MTDLTAEEYIASTYVPEVGDQVWEFSPFESTSDPAHRRRLRGGTVLAVNKDKSKAAILAGTPAVTAGKRQIREAAIIEMDFSELDPLAAVPARSRSYDLNRIARTLLRVASDRSRRLPDAYDYELVDWALALWRAG